MENQNTDPGAEKLKRTFNFNELTIDREGDTVRVAGWVHKIRNLGNLIFVDLRNYTGLVQLVFEPGLPEQHEAASRLHNEWVISVEGKVRARPEGMRNPGMPSGEIEIVANKLVIENECLTLPYDLTDEEKLPSEELGLRYRYLELRRPRFKRNLFLRHKIILATRIFFDHEGFVEIETPFLTKSTPEGARDYLVPSRVLPGMFFALPQSPQLFKQILMISGFEKYYQIVKCFRDEDLRADRQSEFTQIDVEMAFPGRNDVLNVMERMMATVFKEVLDMQLETPFQRLPYSQAMDLYGIDKPDLRFGNTLFHAEDLFEDTELTLIKDTLAAGDGILRGIRVPGGSTASRKILDEIAENYKSLGGKNLFWIKLQESGMSSSIKKFLNDAVIEKLTERAGAENGDLILLGLAQGHKALETAGQLRLMLAAQFNWIKPDQHRFLWVTEFPLFEYNPDTDSYDAAHHPFTSPLEEDIPFLETDPGKVRAHSYDLVLNGVELGSGSVRIHRKEVQNRVFSLLGISEQEAEERFGFFLSALQYGAPPHAGIALGLDRFIMILAGRQTIKDVIAFPKSTRGACLMTESPSPVSDDQLKELSLKVEWKNKTQ